MPTPQNPRQNQGQGSGQQAPRPSNPGQHNPGQYTPGQHNTDPHNPRSPSHDKPGNRPAEAGRESETNRR